MFYLLSFTSDSSQDSSDESKSSLSNEYSSYEIIGSSFFNISFTLAEDFSVGEEVQGVIPSYFGTHNSEPNQQSISSNVYYRSYQLLYHNPTSVTALVVHPKPSNILSFQCNLSLSHIQKPTVPEQHHF